MAREVSMIETFASETQYADHLRALGGRAVDLSALRRDRDEPIVVASYRDLRIVRAAGRKHVALIEHGYGQSYGGDSRSARHSSYPGGTRRDADLFLSPNESAAARDRAMYPRARVEVVGAPKLSLLPQFEPEQQTTIAVSWHWNCAVAPETRSAFPEFADAIVALSQRYRLIGHAHPRAIERLRPWYARHGIEVVESFEDICRRADVYICDTSSTLYEFAWLGRPVVVLNASWYRRKIDHGLRFWDAATVGEQANSASTLEDAVVQALDDDSTSRLDREWAVRQAYASSDAHVARAVLSEWYRDIDADRYEERVTVDPVGVTA